MKNKALTIFLAATMVLMSACSTGKVLTADQTSASETSDATTTAASTSSPETTKETTASSETTASTSEEEKETDASSEPDETSGTGEPADVSSLTLEDVFDLVYSAAPTVTKGIYSPDDNGNTKGGQGCFGLDWGWTVMEFNADSALLLSLKEGDEFDLSISGKTGKYTASAIRGQYVITVYEFDSEGTSNCKAPFSKSEAKAAYDAFLTIE